MSNTFFQGAKNFATLPPPSYGPVPRTHRQTMCKENVNFATRFRHGWLNRLKRMTSSKYAGCWKWISL